MRLPRLLARMALPMMLLTASGCMTVETKSVGEEIGPNSIVIAEIDRRIGEIRYMSGGELLDNLYKLAALGEPAYPAMRTALEGDDWLTRSSIVFVMQILGDRRNIPYVEPLLNDPVRGVRYQAASTLVELGDSSGFSVLVDGLADGEIGFRYKCFQSLKGATGQDFGYRHDGAPAERQVALTRWADWLEDLRTSAL